MKKFVMGIVIGAALSIGVSTIAEQYFTATPNPFDVILNGEKVDIEGYGIDGRTYFQLRDLGEKIGFDVDFVDSQIIIETNTTAKDNPARNSVQTDSVKEEIKTINETTISINGELYYRPTVFVSSHGVSIEVDNDNKAWCIYSDDTDNKTLIIKFGVDDSCLRIVNGSTYVSKEYCDNYIIPAIEEYKASVENK